MMDEIQIRVIDASAKEEIETIAKRMILTLVEVLGEEDGGSMYTLEGTVKRVMWHLNPDEVVAQVLVAENPQGEIVGHTIVRVDDDGEGREVGLFATTYVVPGARRAGVAVRLLDAGERWMLERGLAVAVTYTDENNAKLQNLYLGRGYAMTQMPKKFVKLTKPLA